MGNPDEEFMARALRLAENGLYTTTPNPRVGCVIVKNGRILGEGWTQPAGQNHAEIQALQDARARGEDVRGACVYVSLEPCSHFGRTPPCCDALISAGVARVVAALEDPNPQVAGQGFARLSEAGIEVSVGPLAEEARELNLGFFSRIQRGRPFVRLKIAASLDGKTALANGQSQWITGEAARADGHHWRARACAILTGIGTVLADDPQMNVRAVSTPRQPRRIVLDSQLRTPIQAKFLNDQEGSALIVHARRHGEREDALLKAGAELLCCADGEGRIDLPALLQHLGVRGCNELHVEAGATLNGAFIKTGLVDEYLFYLAPCLLGNPARGLTNLPDYESLDQAPHLSLNEVTRIQEDLRILARPHGQTLLK